MEEAEDESCLWVWKPAVGEGHVIVTEGHQYALLWGNRSGAVAGGCGTEWVEGCGAGKGPQGQGWGSANSGHELQLGPRCPVTVLAALGFLGQ